MYSGSCLSGKRVIWAVIYTVKTGFNIGFQGFVTASMPEDTLNEALKHMHMGMPAAEP